MYKILSIFYILCAVNLSYLDVGKPVTCDQGVYPWTLPFGIGLILGIPSLLAYLAGLNDNK